MRAEGKEKMLYDGHAMGINPTDSVECERNVKEIGIRKVQGAQNIERRLPSNQTRY